MSKILIAIPTKGRANMIDDKILSWLKYTKFEYKFFIEPNEIDDYIKNSSLRIKNIISLDKNNKGLGYCLKYIKNYAKFYKYDYIFKLDDDIVNFRNSDSKVKNVTKEWRCKNKFEPIIEASLEMFDEIESVGGVSIMYGGGKYKSEDLDVWMSMNKRLQTSYITRTELFCPDWIDKIGVFTDFVTYLNIRKLGYQTIEYGRTGMDFGTSDNAVGKIDGGLQLFDRNKLVLEAKEIISNKFKNIVWKEVNKQWTIEPDLRRTKLDEL